MNPPNHRFSRQQKIGLSVLSCLVVLVLGLWYWQLQANIIYPLYGGHNPDELNRQTETPLNSAAQTQDTDKDGLTDAQETAIYHTSPYLPDTDGDGVNDGQEVAHNTDPNCPTGQRCVASSPLGAAGQDSSALLNNATSTADTGQINSDLLSQLNQTAAPTAANLSQSGGAGLTAEQITGLKQAFGDNPDPTILRQKFLEAAPSEDDKKSLNGMTDDQLLQLYQFMIAGN